MDSEKPSLINWYYTSTYEGQNISICYIYVEFEEFKEEEV
jgi:hypothetical protein